MYDIVQCIIYELSSGLMKLRQNIFLLNLSFLLVFILFLWKGGGIFIYQVLFDCEHLVLLYY